jgi:hypothetical protein
MQEVFKKAKVDKRIIEFHIQKHLALPRLTKQKLIESSHTPKQIGYKSA